MAAAAASTRPWHASASATSAVSTWAVAPSASTRAAVAFAASVSMSAQVTVAPARPASTAMARPLPIGASGSAEACVPAPTTRTLRPARSRHAGSAGKSSDSGSTPREFSVIATRWYWPTTMHTSMSCCSSHCAARAAQVASLMRLSAWSSSAARRRRASASDQPVGVGALGDAGDLLVGEARRQPDRHVLAPLVGGPAEVAGAEDEQLALAGRQGAAVEQHAAEVRPPLQQPGVVGERGEDVQLGAVEGAEALEQLGGLGVAALDGQGRDAGCHRVIMDQRRGDPAGIASGRPGSGTVDVQNGHGMDDPPQATRHRLRRAGCRVALPRAVRRRAAGASAPRRRRPPSTSSATPS